MTGKIIKTMLINFIIWLIPTILFLAFSIIVIAIMLGASADASSSSGDKKDPFKKWPKGLIGSLGIGFCLTGILSLCSFFYFDNIDAEAIIYLSGIAIICFLFGYWGVKYDYRRLEKALSL